MITERDLDTMEQEAEVLVSHAYDVFDEAFKGKRSKEDGSRGRDPQAQVPGGEPGAEGGGELNNDNFVHEERTRQG